MPRNPNKTDYSGGFPANFDTFCSITDPRDGGHTLHHFGEILFIAFAGLLCGVRSYELMEEFAHLREDWLRKWLQLPNGIPSYNTFSRVFQAIEPTVFATCIATHLGKLGFVMQGRQIAIDGKALRGSRSGETTHLHAVSAWACESGITLAQAFVGEKTNEITAIPELLEMLNLKGTIVTIDAMGTQRLIAEKIVSKGADYILSVKGNQGRLHDEVRDQFDFARRQLDLTSDLTSTLPQLDSTRWSFASTEESGHDRTEKRQITICHNLDWMDETVRNDWEGLSCIIMVHRTTLFGAGETRGDTSYYMSSLKDVRAEEMLGYIRGHWGIENSCHWVLDAICREDHNQTRDRNAASNLSTLRRIALNAHNLMPFEGKKRKSLPKRELRAASQTSYLENLLSLM
jgi:predicted transposase YbfD/YdcC